MGEWTADSQQPTARRPCEGIGCQLSAVGRLPVRASAKYSGDALIGRGLLPPPQGEVPTKEAEGVKCRAG